LATGDRRPTAHSPVADEIIAKLMVKRLVEHLDAAHFLGLKGAPIDVTDGRLDTGLSLAALFYCIRQTNEKLRRGGWWPDI
jgi:hypothetical protein